MHIGEVKREPLVLIEPGMSQDVPGALEHALGGRDRIFVTVLGVYTFALGNVHALLELG